MGLDEFTAREDGMWAQRVAGSEGERLCCRLGIVWMSLKFLIEMFSKYV